MKLSYLLFLLLLMMTNSVSSQWTQCNNQFGKSISKMKLINGVIYVISDNELAMSTDNATTWLKPNFEIKCDINDIHKSNGYLFLATNNGMYRSSNGGITWNDRSFGLEGKVLSVESEGSYLFCISGNYKELFISTNNGDSWDQASSSIKDQSPSPFTGFRRVGSNLLLQSYSGYERVNIWNGVKFTRVLNIDSKLLGVYSFATDGRVNIYNSGSGIYRSINDGKSITLIRSGYSKGDVEYKDSLLYVYDRAILTSSNYGESWTNITGNLNDYILDYIYIEDSVVVSTKSGIFKSKLKDTNSWSGSNNGLSSMEVNMISNVGNDLYISSSPTSSLDKGLGMLKSIDMGQSWSKIENGFQGEGRFQFVSESDGNLYAGNDFGLFRSQNNGLDWTNIYSGTTVKQLVKISGLLYCVTGKGVIKSSDQGESWSTIYTRQGLNFLTNSRSNLIIGTQDGFVTSSDNGTSWNMVTTNSSVNVVFTLKSNESIVYAGGSKLYRSEDSGLSWVQIIDSIFVKSQFTIYDIENTGNTIFLATSHGVIKNNLTTNTWEFYNQGFDLIPSYQNCDRSNFTKDNQVYGLVLISDRLYAATKYFVLSRKIESSEVTSINIDDNSKLIVSPNPISVNSSLMIRFKSETPKIRKIELSDIMGKVYLNNHYYLNDSEATFVINGLVPSVYILRIFTDNNIYTEKLIINN
jgi:photosystem II stability/assembly factor-like uncharacterized protein